MSNKVTGMDPLFQRSLYRTLLRTARQLDAHPIVKVHTPIHNPIIRKVLGLSKGGALYVPNASNYEQCVRDEFRRKRERTAKEISAGFEAISLYQKSLHVVLGAHRGGALLNASTTAARKGQPSVQQGGHAPLVSKELEADRHDVLTLTSEEAASPPPVEPWVEFQTRPKLAPGTLLISHPLTKAHVDRRVVLLVDVDARDNLVGLVLDLWYSGPVTKGNAMIPEPLWEQSIQYGGPFHVLLTMPPTAAVSALHCGVVPPSHTDAPLPPPTAAAAAVCPDDHTSPPPATAAATAAPSMERTQEKKEVHADDADFEWLFAKETTTEGGAKTPSTGSTAEPVRRRRRASAAHRDSLLPLHAHNNLPHRLVIPGETPLYYTRIEHLSELSEATLGKPRSRVRLFWGFVVWSRATLTQEIADGLWFPCSVSSDFLVRSAMQKPEEDASSPPAASASSPTTSSACNARMGTRSESTARASWVDERFPTQAELERDQAARKQLTGSAAVPPHMAGSIGSVRRDNLWDEIMIALGGEFSSSVTIHQDYVSHMPLSSHEDITSSARGGGSSHHSFVPSEEED